MRIRLTEQYPERLGATVSDLSALLPATGSNVFAKTRFSMCTEEVTAHLENLGCTSVIICGLETHICVLQTSLDLMQKGIDVHVCVDGVSSKRTFDRSVSRRCVVASSSRAQVALTRLVNSGAVVWTAESLLFELLGDSKHPMFKALQPLIKENALIAADSRLQCL